MVSLVIVVADERIDLRFKVAGQIVVFQPDAVLQRLVPTLDLALGLSSTVRQMLMAAIARPTA